MAAQNQQASFGEDSDGLADLFRLFAEQIDDYALILIDLNGRIISWNNGAERLFGYLPSEVIGSPAARLFIPEDQRNGRPEKELADARQTGVATDRNWLQRKDSSRFWASGETVALRTATGALRGFGKICQDITALKEAETTRAKLEEQERTSAEHAKRVRAEADRRAAETAEREINSILESITDAFYAVDQDWRFTYVNRKAAEFWGKSRDELIGKDIWQVFPQVVGTDSYREQLRAMAQRCPVTFETISPVINRWVEAHAYPSGKGLAVYFRDISKRRQAEAERMRLTQELEEERTWLRDVMGQMPVGVILVEGANGEHIVANARMQALFGRSLPPEGGIQQYVGQIRCPNGTVRPREDLAVTRALHGQLVRSEDELLCRPDGSEARVLVSAVPIRTHRQITGAVVVYEDITRLRQLERQREEWTAAIAHDLRQPVTIITAYSGLLLRLLDDHAPPRERAALTHVSEAAWNLNKMIGDLLDVSRVESQHLSLQLVALDLPKLVRDVVERMAAITDGHPVHLDVEGKLPPVEADPSRIEQVLGNLLSNAVKYGDPNTAIQIRVYPLADAVAVSVTNEGPGIQAEEIPRLFRRFYRTARARAAKTSGLGLGLYIGRGIVEAQGGKIWAESTPGKTTTFTFTLPVARDT